MTDEEIDALMNQPVTFFRSSGGWDARATNEAQMVASLVAARATAEARERAEVPRIVARMNEKARAEEVARMNEKDRAEALAREAADARAAEEAKEVERARALDKMLDRRMQ